MTLADVLAGLVILGVGYLWGKEREARKDVRKKGVRPPQPGTPPTVHPSAPPGFRGPAMKLPDGRITVPADGDR